MFNAQIGLVSGNPITKRRSLNFFCDTSPGRYVGCTLIIAPSSSSLPFYPTCCGIFHISTLTVELKKIGEEECSLPVVTLSAQLEIRYVSNV
jgi:hypothetical protein